MILLLQHKNLPTETPSTPTYTSSSVPFKIPKPPCTYIQAPTFLHRTRTRNRNPQLLRPTSLPHSTVRYCTYHTRTRHTHTPTNEARNSRRKGTCTDHSRPDHHSHFPRKRTVAEGRRQKKANIHPPTYERARPRQTQSAGLLGQLCDTRHAFASFANRPAKVTVSAKDDKSARECSHCSTTPASVRAQIGRSEQDILFYPKRFG
jgi:hypothetical protein